LVKGELKSLGTVKNTTVILNYIQHGKLLTTLIGKYTGHGEKSFLEALRCALGGLCRVRALAFDEGKERIDAWRFL